MPNPIAPFDAAIRASKQIHAEAKRREIEEDLRSAARLRCGNCEHWMKSRDCPVEAHGCKPSCNGPACSKFERSRRVVQHIDTLKAKLEEAAHV